MAEWQYRIERVELKPETDLDAELEKFKHGFNVEEESSLV